MKEEHSFNPIAKYMHMWNFSKDLGQRCGKSPRFIMKDLIEAKKLNGISLGEYEWIGYYDLSPQQKKTVSTLWTRAEFRKTHTDRRYISILMNKYIFSKVFAEFYGRRCMLASDVDEQALAEMAADTGLIVVKPNCKGQGKGVKILPAADEQQRSQALDYIRQMGPGIVEEYIVQHRDINAINPKAVSIVRFYSTVSPLGSYLFAPVFTTSVNRDISNGCQDALTAMIDIRSGEIISDAVDQTNIVDYALHPVTQVPFKGLRIPFWQETIDMMKKAVPLAGKISNVGWDVAITEKGPIIIEANTIPGFNTAQYRGYSWINNGYGYQPIFDEGLKGIPFENRENYSKTVLKLS